MALGLAHLVAALVVAGVAACGQGATHDQTAQDDLPVAAVAHAAPAPAPMRDELAGWTDVEAHAHGDAAHGKALVAKYECNRCHAGTGDPAPSFDRQCVHCHQLVVAEKLPVTIELTLFAMVIALGIGIPAGVLAAVKRGTGVSDVSRTPERVRRIVGNKVAAGGGLFDFS